jgi:hypothetical protein
LIGCGAILVLGVVAIVVVGAFIAQRASVVSQDVQDAFQRYKDLDRDIPFTIPANGELQADRFAGYLRVRQVVTSELPSTPENFGGVQFLMTIASLPAKLSQAQVEAMRKESMSLHEYQWITRQVYTTLAAERDRPDGDAMLKDLADDFEMGLRTDGQIRISNRDNRSSSESTFRAGNLDYRWLRVPDATRNLVRQHAVDLKKTAGAVMADQFLMQNFNR